MIHSKGLILKSRKSPTFYPGICQFDMYCAYDSAPRDSFCKGPRNAQVWLQDHSTSRTGGQHSAADSTHGSTERREKYKDARNKEKDNREVQGLSGHGESKHARSEPSSATEHRNKRSSILRISQAPWGDSEYIQEISFVPVVCDLSILAYELVWMLPLALDGCPGVNF